MEGKERGSRRWDRGRGDPRRWGGGDERDKEMGAIGQFTVQGGEKGALERGKITEARRRGKALSLQTARSPSTLPHPPSAMAEERGREARKEAEAAVTLETEPGRWVRGDWKEEGYRLATSPSTRRGG